MTSKEIARVIDDAAKHGRRIRVACNEPVTAWPHFASIVQRPTKVVKEFTGIPESGLQDFDLHDWRNAVSLLRVPYDMVAGVEVLS